MKTFWFCLAVAGAFALPQQAMARNETAVGVGTGAVARALVAGPVGAVVGGIVGGVVGSNSEAGPRRPRRPRIARHRRQPPPMRLARRSSAAPTQPAPAAQARVAPATTWTNPR